MQGTVQITLLSDRGLTFDLYVDRAGDIREAWLGGERVEDAALLVELYEQLDAAKCSAAWKAIDLAARGVAQ